MIDFATLQGLTIPEGVVVKIESGGRILWEIQTGGKAILEVAKITSDTYSGETTYSGENFILLDIYPKTNGTVSVTYGGLTKTITDTSGMAEPNAQQVFFGTFNGVSDNVETPESGILTIEGDFYAFGAGGFTKTSTAKNPEESCCISGVIDFGKITMIPENAFGGIDNSNLPHNRLTSINIPDTVRYIRNSAFSYCSKLVDISLGSGVEVIEDYAFHSISVLSNTVKIYATTPPTLGSNNFGTSTTFIVPVGCGEAYKTAEGWSTYADKIMEAS